MEKESKNALVYLVLIALILFTVSQKSAAETDESLDSKVSFVAQVVEHTHTIWTLSGRAPPHLALLLGTTGPWSICMVVKLKLTFS